MMEEQNVDASIYSQYKTVTDALLPNIDVYKSNICLGFIK